MPSEQDKPVSVGDEVVTIDPLYHQGENVGNRLGTVISAKGHVVVELYVYNNNPIKCFKNEVRLVNHRSEKDNELEEQYSLFEGLFP